MFVYIRVHACCSVSHVCCMSLHQYLFMDTRVIRMHTYTREGFIILTQRLQHSLLLVHAHSLTHSLYHQHTHTHSLKHLLHPHPPLRHWVLAAATAHRPPWTWQRMAQTYHNFGHQNITILVIEISHFWWWKYYIFGHANIGTGENATEVWVVSGHGRISVTQK